MPELGKAMTLPLHWPIICSALVALTQVYAAPQAPVNSGDGSDATSQAGRKSAVAAPHCEHFTVHMERSYLVWCPPKSRRY